MKRIRTIFYMMLCLVAIASCKKNFLDKAPSVNLPEEQVFSNPLLAVQFGDNAYNFLVNDYARLNDHRGITGQAADEAVSSNNDVAVRTLAYGLYHDHYERGGEPRNDIRDVYTRAYSGIRITNTMLAKISSINWTTGQITDGVPDRVKGEMHFLRAYLYFELVKRFGGVVILNRAYGTDEDLDLPRSSYEECVNFIKTDLQAAARLLPPDYDNSNYGRATSGAAKALLSRVLLYAASPLNNVSNDITKWQAAAAAAKAVIDEGKYDLQATYADLLNVPTSPEYIMIKIRGPRAATDGVMVDFAMSPGSGGAQGTLNPTQNHVDLYEMQATGRPITDPVSGYNPAKPYEGRDPRFQANILYNDAPWQGRRIQMWGPVSKDYDQNSTNFTVTRYYCRKMWPEPYLNRVSTGTALLNYIHMRFAEVLLNYAEAQNEVGGPDDQVLGAVNRVRARAGMPALQFDRPNDPGYVANNKDAMRERIRNERAVELAFEDHRWYDIQRWKAGPQLVAQTMYAMNVTRNANGTFTYNKVALPAVYQKVYQDYMHRYPIPRSEIYKSKGILIQNPGW